MVRKLRKLCPQLKHSYYQDVGPTKVFISMSSKAQLKSYSFYELKELNIEVEHQKRKELKEEWGMLEEKRDSSVAILDDGDEDPSST